MKSLKPTRSHEDPDELISNISQLMAEAEEMLSESTSHHAEEKVALLRSGREGDYEGWVDKYLLAKDRIAALAERADHTIRRRPYQAVAIALGLGIIVGASLRRRSG